MSSRISLVNGRRADRPPVALYDVKGAVTTITYSCPPQPPPAVELRHDRRRHRLRITERDGRTAEFDDRAVRFLVMVPDRRTKALQPFLVRGEPLYYYLCPEVPSAPAAEPEAR
jgi:hypothetical protein